jgi:N-acyl-D-aspartate/D-glutamate deacylase
MFNTLALTALLLVPGAEPKIDPDYVIYGVMIHDGTGKAGRKGDLAIKGDRIVAVGKVQTGNKPKALEGKGLIAAPGFIDLHTHSDVPITDPATRANLNYLTQGVTTNVTGNCGFGPVDVAAFYQKIDKGKAGTNVIHLVPHNDLRKQVMGNANRAPTKAELARMKTLVDRGMRDGAWGMSTGLYYTPGSYARLDELVELASAAGVHGGIYASHIRDEGTGLAASVTEAIEIGRQAKLPVHISHMKAYSRRAWGTAADAIALVNKARSRGQAVTADQYPYTASSTSLDADVIPAIFRSGTKKDFFDRLKDAEQGPRVRRAMERLIAECDDGKAIRIAQYGKRPDWQGKDLAAIARQEKKPVLEIVLEIERNGGAKIVNFSMKEEEVRIIMKQPFVATASDGLAMIPGNTVPHPRNYGCFPRKIGRYALADKVISLEQAIRSASGLPADILRLPQRGYLKKGYYADVVVFDPKTFRDRATFAKPHQYASGVRFLFVNGVLTIDNGKYTGALAGKALRHEERKSSQRQR